MWACASKGWCLDCCVAPCPPADVPLCGVRVQDAGRMPLGFQELQAVRLAQLDLPPALRSIWDELRLAGDSMVPLTGRRVGTTAL